MRTLNLAKVGVQAEGLRLRQLLRRTVTRLVFAMVAAVFLIAVLIAAHVAIGMALVPWVTPVQAVLIVGAGDLIIAIILGVVAGVSKPGRIEREAYEVRETARVQLVEAMTLTTLLGPLARLIGGRKLYGMTLAALTARYLGARR